MLLDQSAARLWKTPAINLKLLDNLIKCCMRPPFCVLSFVATTAQVSLLK
jgi:hypothetical protein